MMTPASLGNSRENRGNIRQTKNYRRMRKTICLLLCLFFASASLYAQGNKALAEAERLYSVKSYEAALSKFLEAIEAGSKDPMVHYKTGVCYQKSAELSEQV